MRAENDDFIRLLIAANLANDILLLDRSANFIGHFERDFHFARIRTSKTRQPHRVFTPDNRLRDSVDPAVEEVCMPLEEHPLPRPHPHNSPTPPPPTPHN